MRQYNESALLHPQVTDKIKLKLQILSQARELMKIVLFSQIEQAF